MIFSTCKSLMKIEPLDPQCGITGYSVGLAPAIIWAVREARLHNSATPTMIFNLKLDGRPFAGTVMWNIHCPDYAKAFNSKLQLVY